MDAVRSAGRGAVAATAARRENLHVATLLREGADLLEQQGDNPFRVAAYRRGADTVEALGEPLAELVARRGRQGLDDLPQIGPGIASAILQILRTGRWGMLERLRGEASPEKLFQTVPGIGPRLAERLHAHLGVDTLEGLEIAAYDGRLEAVPGIGPRRAAAIRASLASLLGRPRRRAADRPRRRPAVGTLLAVDEEYRRRAAAGDLTLLAPRRFNPERRAWLPVLHATRDGWSFTALFSNTALAHQLGRTGDWVVLFFADAEHREDQATVVTEARGVLAGRRVVRGREAECHGFYVRAAGSPRAEGLRNVVAGSSAVALQRGVERGVAVAVEALKAMSKPVVGRSFGEE